MEVIFGIIALLLLFKIVGALIQKNENQQPTAPPTRNGRSNWRRYEINPPEEKCTCPDWVKMRQQFKKGDPRRLCKHLCSFYAEKGIPPEIKLYQDEIMFSAERCKGINPYRDVLSINYSQEQVIVMVPSEEEVDLEEGQGWAGVFFRGKRYGFNPVVSVWANSAKGQIPIELAFQVETEVCKKLNLPLPKQESIGEIKTLSRQTINKQGHVQVSAKAEDGTEISATIKPRGKIIALAVDGCNCKLDTRDEELDAPAEYYKSIDKITSWAIDEDKQIKEGLYTA